MSTIYIPDLIKKWYSVNKPTTVYKYAPLTGREEQMGVLSPGTSVLIYGYSPLTNNRTALLYYNSKSEARWIIFNDSGSANLNKLFEQGVRTVDEKTNDDKKATTDDEKTWYEKAIKAFIPLVVVGGIFYGLSQVGKTYVEKKL